MEKNFEHQNKDIIFPILQAKQARGKNRVVPTKELMNLTGLSARDIKKQVQRERGEHLIMSTTNHGGGYFLPVCVGDVQHFVDSWTGRIKQAGHGLKLARHFLRRMKEAGQEKLW